MEKEQVRQLVERAKAKDEQALYELYEECFPNVYYLALRMMKNTQDAEDITQETFLAVWKSIGTLVEADAFFGWVNLIAANKCREFLRKKGIPLAVTEDETVENLQVADLDEALLPQSSLDNEETRRLVLKIVDSLPEAQRMCVLLYYYQNMSVEQVAGAMECSVGTVKSRLSAARTKIRVGIETLEEKEDIRLHAIGLLPFFAADAQSIQPPTGLQQELFKGSLSKSDLADGTMQKPKQHTENPKLNGSQPGTPTAGIGKRFMALSSGAKAGIIVGAVALVAALALGGMAAAGVFANNPSSIGVSSQPESVASSLFESISEASSGMQREPITGELNQLTEIEYSFASEFYNGYAFAVKNDQCGYVDLSGKFTELYPLPDTDFLQQLIDTSPNNVEEFALTASKEAVVPFYDEALQLWGYYSIKDNEVIIQPEYIAAYPFRDGAAVVTEKSATRKVISTNGETIYSGTVYGNYYRLGLNTVKGSVTDYAIIDTQGNVIYEWDCSNENGPPVLEQPTPNNTVFSKVDPVMTFNGFTWGDDPDMLRIQKTVANGHVEFYHDFIRRDGTVVVSTYSSDEDERYQKEYAAWEAGRETAKDIYGSFTFDAPYLYSDFYNGTAIRTLYYSVGADIVNKNLEVRSATKDDGTGQMISVYFAAWKEENGLRPVANDGLIGFVDDQFNEVIPAQYTDVQFFSEDSIAGVQLPDGKWGAIDSSGNTVIPFEWSYIGRFENGLACAKKMENEDFCIIDRLGNIVVEERFVNVCTPEEGIILVAEKQENGLMRYGFLH